MLRQHPKLRHPQLHCPYCNKAMDVSWDMWGEFYVCEGCGFAVDDDRALKARMATAVGTQEYHRQQDWFSAERR